MTMEPITNTDVQAPMTFQEVYELLTDESNDMVECMVVYCERHLLTTPIQSVEDMRLMFSQLSPLDELLSTVTYPLLNQEFWIRVMDVVWMEQVVEANGNHHK